MICLSCHGPNDLTLCYVLREPSLINRQLELIKMSYLYKYDNIILPGDKGHQTIILNKEGYITKCNDHIDNGPYIHLKNDLK